MVHTCMIYFYVIDLMDDMLFLLTGNLERQKVNNNKIIIFAFQYEGKNSVLFLCRDNYMRSPMIKAIFMEMLALANQTDKWIVESAGIGWWDVGKGMDPRAQERCELYGLNTHHVAREICEDDFYKFDYIIATDETDLSFLKLEAPKDNRAKICLLGDFTSKCDFHIEDKNFVDPFFLKTKALYTALDDIVNRGYWHLLGFLDTLGIQLPITTTIEKKVISTIKKYRTSTLDPWRVKISLMQAAITITHFKDRVTVKSTHRKLQ